MLRSELDKCRDCKHYEWTRVGKQGGMYGRCKVRNSRTDRAEGRQGGCYACNRFAKKEVENMNETTRIITAKITIIEKGEYVGLHSKEEFKKECGAALKSVLGADDVVIEDVQDFVRDIEE